MGDRGDYAKTEVRLARQGKSPLPCPPGARSATVSDLDLTMRCKAMLAGVFCGRVNISIAKPVLAVVIHVDPDGAKAGLQDSLADMKPCWTFIILKHLLLVLLVVKINDPAFRIAISNRLR